MGAINNFGESPAVTRARSRVASGFYYQPRVIEQTVTRLILSLREYDPANRLNWGEGEEEQPDLDRSAEVERERELDEQEIVREWDGGE